MPESVHSQKDTGPAENPSLNGYKPVMRVLQIIRFFGIFPDFTYFAVFHYYRFLSFNDRWPYPAYLMSVHKLLFTYFVIPRLDRGIQSFQWVLDPPVKPEDDKL
jgi:hypothetical protein